MSQKTYMYDTQWTALINAINGGDTSAIATALGQIKTSVDGITTALGSLSTDVTQDSTQWTNLINAITSGGGGGGGTIDIDATQWSDLLTEIGKGDMTATATALNNIYTRLNSIGFNSTQWTNLVNAITNQSLNVNLSNINTDNTVNMSNVIGSNVTRALNRLNDDIHIIETLYDGGVYAVGNINLSDNIYYGDVLVFTNAAFSSAGYVTQNMIVFNQTPTNNWVQYPVWGSSTQFARYRLAPVSGSSTLPIVEVDNGANNNRLIKIQRIKRAP